MKSNKGITLVALVITIIVLLILAGVSISLVVGDNGVLSNAKKGAKETIKADIEETLGRMVLSAQTDFLSNGETGNLFDWLKTDTKSKMQKSGEEADYTLTITAPASGAESTANEIKGSLKKNSSNTTYGFTITKPADSGRLALSVVLDENAS